MTKKKSQSSPPTVRRRRLSPEAMAWLPRSDFPLSPHLPTRRWYRKIRGTRYYFGPLDDSRAAEDRYNRVKDDLYAGRTPRDPGDGYTVAQMCNEYLTAQHDKVLAGDLQQRTYDEYYRACEQVVQEFGRSRMVRDLAADDFQSLRATMAKKHSVSRLGIVIQHTRQIFKWVWENSKIENQVRYGQAFKKPSARAIRASRNARPVKLFSAKEIRLLLKHANVSMRAFVLLGINAGFGNTDVSEVAQKDLKLSQAIVDFPRPKTGVQRRVPLWPETIEAIWAALNARPEPKNPNDAYRAFLTVWGTPWVRYHSNGDPAKPKGCLVDNISRQFQKIKKSSGVGGKQRGFYALRHTFETIGGETGDQVAVDFMMGHAPVSDDMSAIYREWTGRVREMARLKRVTDHVHDWLFPPVKKTRRKKTAEKTVKMP